MSVHGVAEKVAEVLRRGEDDFVMCNFAPPDMVCASANFIDKLTYSFLGGPHGRI